MIGGTPGTASPPVGALLVGDRPLRAQSPPEEIGAAGFGPFVRSAHSGGRPRLPRCSPLPPRSRLGLFWVGAPFKSFRYAKGLGAAGFEPATYWSRTSRSTKLSHAPTSAHSRQQIRLTAIIPARRSPEQAQRVEGLSHAPIKLNFVATLRDTEVFLQLGQLIWILSFLSWSSIMKSSKAS